MLRRLLAFCGLISLAGCLLNPVPPRPLPAPVVETVRLFGKEMVPSEPAVYNEVLRLIAPGMPMDRAAALLQAHGLAPRSYPLDDIPAEFTSRFMQANQVNNPCALQCFAFPAVLGEWGRRYVAVRVIVTPDSADAVKDVSVLVCGPGVDRWSSFFEPRPGLQEPVGLPVAEAQARMEAAGFRCCAVGTGARGLPHLYCQALAEQAPWQALAVRLYYDEAGVVRDTEIVRQPRQEVRLLGKVLPTDEWVIRDEILRSITPGMPLAQARDALAGHGLTAILLPAAEFYPALRYRERFRPNQFFRTGQTLCAASAEDANDWGRTYRKVLVALFHDAAHAVKDVRVVVSPPLRERAADIFAARMDLTGPIGLPLAEARARMEAAGFRCSPAGGDAESKGRPYWYCQMRVETALGGYVLRVRLYPDQTWVVRDAEILREDRWFEAERCMLPAADDPPEWIALRAALFPARVGCRYTLIMLALALSGPPGGGGHVCVGHHGR
jgi:hypothetical protein